MGLQVAKIELDQLNQVRTDVQQRVESLMSVVLENSPLVAEELNNAMRYSALNGGKRVRPLLIYATADALCCDRRRVDPAAVAVEFIHSYSLVHDDLPAMDDDDLRRGKPTCHIVFNEAMAILAGDALQSLAYEVLADKGLLTGESNFDLLLASTDAILPIPNEGASVSASQRMEMIKVLASASGTAGMAAGQVLDLESQGQTITIDQLEKIHRNKTGRLIEASIEMAVIAAGLQNSEQANALKAYGRAIGLAFQVRDDILDVIGSTADLGKEAGADEQLDKATFPSILGLSQAEEQLQNLHQQALEALDDFGEEANVLRAISEYTVSRTS